MSPITKLLKRRSTTEAMWGLVSEGTTIVSTMIIFVLLGRSLGPETYGAYIGLFALVSLFQPFTGQGGVPMTMYEYIRRNGEDPLAVVRSCMSIALLGGAILVPFVVWLAQGTVKDNMTLGTIVVFVLAELVVGALTMSLIASLQATIGFGRAARARASVQALRVAVVVGLYATSSLNLRNLAIGLLITRSANMIYIYTVTATPLGERVRPAWPQMRHVKSSMLYAATQSAKAVQNSWALVVLNRTDQSRDAGLYGAASRVMNLGTTPQRAVMGSTHLTFLDPRQNKLKLAARLSVLGLAFASVFIAVLFVAAPMIKLVLGDEFEEAVTILRWMIPLIVIKSMVVWPMNAIMGLGKNAFRAGSAVVTAVGAILIYQLLVPDHGWRGAVVGATIIEGATLVMAWIALIYFQRQEPDPEPTKWGDLAMAGPANRG